MAKKCLYYVLHSENILQDYYFDLYINAENLIQLYPQTFVTGSKNL